MNLKETYNRIAEDWHRGHHDDDWWLKGTDKFVSFFKKNDIILDVGCGTGVKAKYLTNKGLRVIGIDFAQKQIEIAKKFAPQAKYYVMDMRQCDRLTGEFDGIFAQASLFHIPKKEIPEVLKIILSKLKRGGYFYLAVKERKKVDEEIKVEDDLGYQYERFYSYFTHDEIRNYFKKSGLEIIFEEICRPGNANWIQVIGKKDK